MQTLDALNGAPNDNQGAGVSIHWPGGMIAMARFFAPSRWASLPATALDACARSLVFVDWADEEWQVPADNADTAARIRAAAVPVSQADIDIDFDSDIRPFNLSDEVTDLGPSMGAQHMVLQVVRASGEWAQASSVPLGYPAAAAGGASTTSPSELAACCRARCAAYLRAILGNMGAAAGLRDLIAAGGWRQGAEWKLPLVQEAGEIGAAGGDGVLPDYRVCTVQPSIRAALPLSRSSRGGGGEGTRILGAPSSYGGGGEQVTARAASCRPAHPPFSGVLRLQATYVRERDGVIAPALILQLLLNEGRTLPAAYAPVDHPAADKADGLSRVGE